MASFIYSQLFVSLPSPETSFSGKTVIVTGSNVGLGKEATRHIARLGAEKLIMAVRDVEKGEVARKDILATTGRPESSIEVWNLDLASYASTQAFAGKASKLKRLDVLLENAGIATDKYSAAEDNERTITVNVVSTFLLAFLLLPKLKETASKFNTKPVLTIVSSEVHAMTSFAERNKGPSIFDTLNENKTELAERYPVSKLLEVFAVRAFTERYPSSSMPVVLNMVNPGLCYSELNRDGNLFVTILSALTARTTEAGSRTLVDAASRGPESHGQYMSDCKIGQPSAFVRSEDGKKTQDRVWDELLAKLEKIKPGVTQGF